jgi:hypothetical protein
VPLCRVCHKCSIAAVVFPIFIRLDKVSRGVFREQLLRIFNIFQIMMEPHVVSYLVAHDVFCPRTLLAHCGERLAGGEGVEVALAASLIAYRLLGQQDGHVGRVAYGSRLPTLRAIFWVKLLCCEHFCEKHGNFDKWLEIHLL